MLQSPASWTESSTRPPPPLVRPCESRTTGRGVKLVPGTWVPKGTPLGLYFGYICRSPASDEYALELGRFCDADSPST